MVVLNETHSSWVWLSLALMLAAAIFCEPEDVERELFRRPSGGDDEPVVRAELGAHRAEAETHVNLTRQADHLLATAVWNGASVARRARAFVSAGRALTRDAR